MADAAVFERPATTHEVVLAELRRRIVAGEIVPGDAIRPDQLAIELRVSRVPIREALRILEGEGVVAHRPHHGAVLATLRAEDLREIYRLRQSTIRQLLPFLGNRHDFSIGVARAILAAAHVAASAAFTR